MEKIRNDEEIQKVPQKAEELFSRGRRNRTLVDGFGDRCSTAELCPFIQFMFSRYIFSLTKDIIT